LKTVPVTSGINRDEDVIIVNSNEDPATIRRDLKITVGKVWTVPATEIAIRILVAPITNTALLGGSCQSNRCSHNGRHRKNR